MRMYIHTHTHTHTRQYKHPSRSDSCLHEARMGFSKIVCVCVCVNLKRKQTHFFFLIYLLSNTLFFFVCVFSGNPSESSCFVCRSAHKQAPLVWYQHRTHAHARTHTRALSPRGSAFPFNVVTTCAGLKWREREKVFLSKRLNAASVLMDRTRTCTHSWRSIITLTGRTVNQ